jgi:hypothetical protein
MSEAAFSEVYAVVVAKQQRGKHVFGATNPDATIEELCFLGPCKGVTGGLYRLIWS